MKYNCGEGGKVARFGGSMFRGAGSDNNWFIGGNKILLSFFSVSLKSQGIYWNIFKNKSFILQRIATFAKVFFYEIVVEGYIMQTCAGE